MNENDILGFDPTQLTVFSQTERKPQGSQLVYHTRPEESKANDGVYRSTIKVIYNPFNLPASVIEQQGYYIEDAQGGLFVVSSLTNDDTSCPIFKAWKKCRYSDAGSVLWKQQAGEDKGGRALFDKRFARYVTIQVMEDKNHPELEGKYMFWKVPKSIWEMIDSKQHPSVESGKCPIPVMDFLFGRSIELEVKPGQGPKGSLEYRRGTSYIGELSEDTTSCTNPDKTPLLTPDEQNVLDTYVAKVKLIWKEKDPEVRKTMNMQLNSDPITQQLKTIYNKVLESIKQVCPNVLEEMGYKPWDEATTNRVNNWINVVLSGDIPKKMDNNEPPAMFAGAQAAINNATTMPENPFFSAPEPAPATAPETFTAPTATAEDDDLPF